MSDRERLVSRNGLPPLRVVVLWALVSISAFMVLLWPLDLLGLDGAARFVAAVGAGLVTGVAIARLTWRAET